MSRASISAAGDARRNGRHGYAAILACLLTLIGVLTWTSSAAALLQRGHEFTGSFGSGFGEEEKDRLLGPTAVTVNEASTGEGAGDVYVLDTAANRVVRFGPSHEFLEAWGYGVEGGATYQRCTTKCGPGIAGFAKGQFDSPNAIAVDNFISSPSRGDVYVSANTSIKHTIIDKFNAKGELLGTLISKGEREETEGPVVGIAVDHSGGVWVEREDETEAFLLEHFNNQSTNALAAPPAELEIENVEGAHPVRPGFAIDSHENIYVTYEPGGKDAEELTEEEEEIAEREVERKKAHEELKHEQPQQPCVTNSCFVAKIPVSDQEGELEASEPLSYELDAENSTGIAVDGSSGAKGSDDAYLDNATSIAAFAPGGSLIQRFGAQQLTAGGGRGLAVDARTGEVLVADVNARLIDVFGAAKQGPPTVRSGSVGAVHVGSTSAELRAIVDPVGADTHYRFEFGTSSCAVAMPACAEAPTAPGTDIGKGFGDQVASVQIASLTPDTTYHIRVIAENNPEGKGVQVVTSEERTFVTAPAILATALPDARLAERVSPSDLHGAAVEPIPREGGLVQAAADGTAVTYMTTGPVGKGATGDAELQPEGNRAPERSQILSNRVAGKWSTRDIVTPNQVAEGTRGGLNREYQYFALDLGEALLEPPSPQLLSTQATEPTLYRRHNVICPSAPASCFEPLITPANDTAGTKFGNTSALVGATPDLHHAILTSSVPLLAGEASGGLYEWSNGGTLSPISILPGGTQASGVQLSLGGGAAGQMSATAISHDGSRVEWRVGGLASGHLYMRDVEHQQTLEVDEPNSDAPVSTVAPLPEFDTASADGSKIFFTDTQRLTANSTAPENAAGARDLYVFEPAKPAGKRITDLTPDLNSGEGAAVQGSALAGASGNLVYFVANGVLAAGATPGACRFRAPSGARCSLYVAHEGGEGWEPPRLIGRLASEDNPDWGKPEGEGYELKSMTSRVSPNGEYLAFMSNQALTGYNNLDANSGVADEEVFLYHYDSGGGGLICASCNPSGAQPVGVLDTEEAGEGTGLVVDRREIWGTGFPGVAHWLAGSIPGWTGISLLTSGYQSRYLSDAGRLFFNSADPLVAKDVNGNREDVYQYEPAGVGSCQAENTSGGCVALITSGESEHESAFLDASENGNDVFVLSVASVRSTFEIYDARVCGVVGAEACASPPPTPAPPCDSEACKAPGRAPQSYGTPASSSISGAGNIPTKPPVTTKTKPPTRAQRLARALKKCHRLKQTKKRTACERQARRSYRASKARARARRSAKPTARRGGVPR